MGNKPEHQQLQKWWKAAILEGLNNQKKYRFLNFNLVYWASVLHKEPIPLSILNEPYLMGSETEPHKDWRNHKKTLRDRFNDQMDKIFLEKDGSLNFSKLTDFILKHFLKEVDAYYRKGEEQTAEKICSILADTLRKHRRKKIMLIAHSMGSIIAWDVLTRWVPEIKIHTLVTIGSPLGNPIVRSRMFSEMEKKDGQPLTIKTPENITDSWFNLSDYKDRVAISYDLKEDFLPNHRQIQPIDKIVWNNYEYNGERNPHKSYGYLRCPEMAEIINDFYRFKLFKSKKSHMQKQAVTEY